jgi:hypothetical protein
MSVATDVLGVRGGQDGLNQGFVTLGRVKVAGSQQGQKKSGRRRFTSPASMGGIVGIGSWHEPLGKAACGESKKLLLYGVLEAGTFVQGFTQAPAAIQVTQHCFNKKVSRFTIFGPFQLLLASAQMLNGVLEPEQICFTLGHGITGYLSRLS